jgi:hypothetical protein
MNNHTYTKEELEELEMQPHAITAFLKLQSLGCPVRVPVRGDDRGHFWISAEEVESEGWLDYYSDTLFWGSEQLNTILDDNNLFWEWYNPAYGNVYGNFYNAF